MAKTRKAVQLPVIGWREWVGLHKLGIASIKAKIDTGARSSSIHAYDIETFRRKGKLYARFIICPLQRSRRSAIETSVRIVEYRKIRSSNGKTDLRPVILTPVTLFGETWDIELTLANRDEMGFRMLLGREAIRKRFFVDVGRSYLGEKL